MASTVYEKKKKQKLLIEVVPHQIKTLKM